MTEGHNDFMLFSNGRPIAQFDGAEAAHAYLTRNSGVLPNPVIRQISSRPDLYWITKDRRVLALDELSDDHLVRILTKIANGRFTFTATTMTLWQGLKDQAFARGFNTLGTSQGAVLLAAERAVLPVIAQGLLRGMPVAPSGSTYDPLGLRQAEGRLNRPERSAPQHYDCTQCGELFWVSRLTVTAAPYVCPDCQAKLDAVRAAKALEQKPEPEDADKFNRFKLIELD